MSLYAPSKLRLNPLKKASNCGLTSLIREHAKINDDSETSSKEIEYDFPAIILLLFRANFSCIPVEMHYLIMILLIITKIVRKRWKSSASTKRVYVRAFSSFAKMETL